MVTERAVEKHVTGVFAVGRPPRLPDHRRVRAVLTLLDA